MNTEVFKEQKKMISILIATKNRCSNLNDIFQSLLEQDHVSDLNFEVILADNGSSDDTKKIVEAWISKFNGRLKYCFEPKGHKWKALNTGLNFCKGSIIAFTDDDCIAPKDWIAKIWDVFEEKDVDIIGGRCFPILYQEKPEWFDHHLCDGPFVRFDLGEKYLEFKNEWTWAWGANFAFRVQSLKKYGNFRPAEFAEDAEIFVRWFRLGAKSAYAPSVVMHHKTEDARLTKKYVAKRKYDWGLQEAIIFPNKYRGKGYSLFQIPIKAYTGFLKVCCKRIMGFVLPNQDGFANAMNVYYQWGVLVGLHKVAKKRNNARRKISKVISRSHLQSNRLVVFDSALDGQTGHHLNYALGLQSAANNVDLESWFFMNKTADQQTVDTVNGIRFFSLRTYTSVWDVHHMDENERLCLNKELCNDLTSFKVINLMREDIVVFPTVTHIDIHSISEWIKTIPVDERPVLILFALFDSKFMAETEDLQGWVENNYRLGYQKLIKEFSDKNRLHIVCETKGLADYHEKLSDHKVLHMPMPNALVPKKELQEKAIASNDIITIVCAGAVTEEKGYGLLPEVIKTVCSLSDKVRFLIHANKDIISKELEEMIVRIQDIQPEIEFLSARLKPAEFHAFLKRGDIILLPYDPVAYAQRGSAIAYEAMMLGKPIVVPKEASFAQDSLQEGTSIGFDVFTSEAIAHATLEAIEKVELLTEKAQDLSKAQAGASGKLERLLTKAMKS